MSIFGKVRKSVQGLPDKKRYVEFFSAFLSLPVLITVILMNVNNLNNMKKNTPPGNQPLPTEPAPSPTQSRVKEDNLTASEIEALISSTIKESTLTPSPTSEPDSPTPKVCKNEIGPVEIISPREGEVVGKDPVLIDINHNKDEYCAVVWSYSLNGQPWTDFTDKAIYLYNLTSGEKRLEVRVKSVATGNEVLLKKNFIYQVENSPTPSPQPTTTLVQPTLTP
ncbi:MAG: hypothetical protein ACOX6N_03095 [Patescibacteria group bacterium]|jgi:hypothetical protein